MYGVIMKAFRPHRRRNWTQLRKFFQVRQASVSRAGDTRIQPSDGDLHLQGDKWVTAGWGSPPGGASTEFCPKPVGRRVHRRMRCRNPVPWRTLNHISEAAGSPKSRRASVPCGERKHIREAPGTWKSHCPCIAISVCNMRNLDGARKVREKTIVISRS
ncbi:hypothetical protein VUR80DRAFT_2598 [Thermomyces stellatus]